MGLTDHCVEVLPRDADRADWLRVRREGMGGSDCSAIMGLSKYASPYTVWEDKTGRADASPESEAMFWGTLLEPVIREEAMRRLGLEFELPGTLQSLVFPWQQANLDGLASDGGVIECKNTSAWMSADWDEQIPDHAELQCQHNMSVTGAPHAWVAGLIGGNRLRIARVERDDELIELICNEEHRLWHEHVLTDVPPPMDASDATRAALLRRWPVEDREIALDAPDSTADVSRVLDLAAQWKQAHVMEKAGVAAKKAAENEFRLLMEGASHATVDGQMIARFSGSTWAPRRFEDSEPELAATYRTKVDVIDSAAVRRDHPHVWKRYQAQRFQAFPFTKQEG